MPLREQDRVVWVGAGDRMPVGSSGKVRSVEGGMAIIDWGGGSEFACEVGTEVVTPREAAKRGIEPWATAHGGGSTTTTEGSCGA